MLLFYVDECGDAKALVPGARGTLESQPGPSPWFVLAAVGIRDTSRQPAAEAMLAFKNKHLDMAGNGDDAWERTEIKGRYLAQASRSALEGSSVSRPAWRGTFGDPVKAAGAVHVLSNIFARFRPTIFVVAIDKVRLAAQGNPVDPLGAAYAIINERVAQTLDRVVSGESAMFVADQQVEHEAYFRDGRMNAAREEMSRRLNSAPLYQRVLDKPLWIDTALSTWDREIIQLADIAAYSTYQLVKRGSAPPEPHYMWPAVESCLARHWGSGRVQGGGLAIYPPPTRYPRLTPSELNKS
jgi:hypothetical protein